MNSFMRYDSGTLAVTYFEHNRRANADFQRMLYDLRIAMYKTTYMKEYNWPEHEQKSNIHQVRPELCMMPKPNEEQLKQLYSPKIIFRKLADDKGIVPPLEYSNKHQDKSQEFNSSETNWKSMYQESYVNNQTKQEGEKMKTIEDWTQNWKNECQNVRDSADLVHNLSQQTINAKKTLLGRKKIFHV